MVGDASVDLSENRRLVTVLFADLSGSTPLGERLDPEDLRRILGSFFSALAREIRYFGGTVDKYIGDAIMAVFGAPVAHEDDAERAISAAMAMQRAIDQLNDDLDRRHGTRLALRIGIHTGEVVAGLLAGDVQGAYTVVGDTVNTAQRFEAAAPPGGILVSEVTRRLAQRAFEFDSLPPLVLKGKSEPQAAFTVQRRRTDDLQAGIGPLVGRGTELAWLSRLVDSVGTGRGRLVLLTGEAGIGKTRLINELRLGLAPSVDFLRVRCVSFEDNTPYALVGRLVRGLLRLPPVADTRSAHDAILSAFGNLGHEIDPTTVAVLLDVLGYRERTSFDPEVTRRVLLSVLRSLVRQLSARAMLVLVAEDLQWADQASAAVMSDLAHEVMNQRCVLLASARSGWTPPWTCERLDLEALSPNGSRELVESAFGGPVESSLADAILMRTGGNPLFIEEVVRDLRDSGRLELREGNWSAGSEAASHVPATIQELLAARLDRLPDRPRRVLDPAAVCGRVFWLRVLQGLVSLPTLQDDLGLLEKEAFIVPRDLTPEMVYAFRHTLIQEVAYQTQLQSQRRRIHGAVAGVLESLYVGRIDEVLDLLAYHYARSEQSAKAVEYLVRAGDRARRLFANEEAARYYSQALEQVPEPRLRRTALEGLGEVQAPMGQLAASRESFQQALALAEGEPIEQARLQRKIALTYVRAGDYQNATAWLDRALESVKELTTDPEIGAIWLDRTQVAWRQGRYDEAIESGQRAISHCEQSGSLAGLAEGEKHLGTAHVLKGERQIGAQHYQRALALYDQLQDLPGLMNVHNNLGIIYRRDSRWADALREQQHALTLAQRVGDAWSIGMTLANIGETLRGQGDFEGALASNQEALGVWTQAEYLVGVATVNMNIGILNAEHGQLEAAREALQRSLAQWQELDSRLFLPELYRTLAKVEQERDPALALDWAQRSLEVARDIKARDEEGVALQVLGAMYIGQGRLEDAQDALEESIGILRSTGSDLELARSLFILAGMFKRKALPFSAFADEAIDLFAKLSAAHELDRARELLS